MGGKGKRMKNMKWKVWGAGGGRGEGGGDAGGRRRGRLSIETSSGYGFTCSSTNTAMSRNMSYSS